MNAISSFSYFFRFISLFFLNFFFVFQAFSHPGDTGSDGCHSDQHGHTHCHNLIKDVKRKLNQVERQEEKKFNDLKNIQQQPHGNQQEALREIAEHDIPTASPTPTPIPSADPSVSPAFLEQQEANLSPDSFSEYRPQLLEEHTSQALDRQEVKLDVSDGKQGMDYSAKTVIFYKSCDDNASPSKAQNCRRPVFTNIKSVIFSHDQNRNLNLLSKKAEEEAKKLQAGTEVEVEAERKQGSVSQ